MFLDSKFLLPKDILYEKYFGPKVISVKKNVCTKSVLDTNFSLDRLFYSIKKNLDQIFLLTKIVLIIYIFGNLWQLKATPSCFMINSDIGGGPFFVTILYATCGGKKGKGSLRVKIFLFSLALLGLKLNTKIGLETHPPTTQTF